MEHIKMSKLLSNSNYVDKNIRFKSHLPRSDLCDYSDKYIVVKGTIYFLVKNDKFLEKYNAIWDKVSNTIKNGFDSESVYNEKYLRTKTKPCEGKITAHFHEDNIQKTVNVFAYQ